MAIAKPLTAELRRAARLSRVPGLTVAEAAARFGVSESAVKRARREHPAETALTTLDLLLAALTNQGRLQAGELGDLDALAKWMDYVNHDGSTADDVEGMLVTLETSGVLAREGQRWRLLTAWP